MAVMKIAAPDAAPLLKFVGVVYVPATQPLSPRSRARRASSSVPQVSTLPEWMDVIVEFRGKALTKRSGRGCCCTPSPRY